MELLLTAVFSSVVDWILKPLLDRAQWPRRWHLAVLLILAALFWIAPRILSIDSAQHNFLVQARSRSTGDPIEGAEAILELSGGYLPIQQITDSRGFARFAIDKEQVGIQARLTVIAEGYQRTVQLLEVNPSDLPYVAQLSPEPIDGLPQSSQTPTEVTHPLGGEVPARPSATPPASKEKQPSEPIPPEEITVGIIHIESYIYDDIIERVKTLGFSAEWIESSSDYYRLDDFEVIYLPTGWAYEGAIIGANESAYKAFLEQGGGLLIEQPNSGGKFTPVIFPFYVTFELLEYDSNEWPPKIRDTGHYLTQGLAIDEVPGPQNHITNISERYQVLVTSRSGTYPTLAIAQYGAGRILISTGNASPLAGSTISDTLYRRFFYWLAGQE